MSWQAISITRGRRPRIVPEAERFYRIGEFDVPVSDQLFRELFRDDFESPDPALVWGPYSFCKALVRVWDEEPTLVYSTEELFDATQYRGYITPRAWMLDSSIGCINDSRWNAW